MSDKKSRARLIIFSDGAARGNPGPAGAGGLIKDSTGEVLAEISEYLGETTNNVAEYKALILTLEKALQYGKDEVKIYLDSELLVRQLTGAYKVKNSGLKPLFERARQLLTAFNKAGIEHIYRSENAHADELANKAIDKFIKGEKAEKKIDNIPGQESLF